MRRAVWAIVTAAELFALSALADEPQSTSEAPPAVVDEVNNPLTPAFGLLLNNFYTPTVFGRSGTANSLEARTFIPFKLGLAQIARLTVPLQTLSDPQGGEEKSGLGDLTLFDVVLLPATDTLRFGVGPQATLPTASPGFLGDQKWKLGLAALATWTPSRRVMVNSIVTWEASVAGKSSRASTDVLTLNPVGILYVGSGFYLRTGGRWTFNFASGRYSIPFGLGAGRVTKVGRVAINVFLEPEFIVLHSGIGEPALQILAGLGFQVQ